MLYQFAHILQSKIPWIWSVVEWGNGILFKICYGKKLKREESILEGFPNVKRVQDGDLDALVSFFASQPAEAYRYFRPHAFDQKTLRRLSHNPSFLMYVYKINEVITGYFFLRSFFIGKTYLGKMVDHQQQGRGIGQTLCLCAMDLASLLGLKMFETISKENLASLYSSQKVLEVKVLEEMENGYLLLEDVRKKSNT